MSISRVIGRLGWIGMWLLSGCQTPSAVATPSTDAVPTQQTSDVDGAVDSRPVAVAMRDVLLGDAPWDRWIPADAGGAGTWAEFVSARAALDGGDGAEARRHLQRIVQTPELESLHYAQAWHFLRQLGEDPPPQRREEILGVVVEVSLDRGLDLIAAYPDGNLRLYNAESGVVVLPEDGAPVDPLAAALLDAASLVVEQAGVAEGARPPPPSPGYARITVITPAGLRYAEAETGALADHPATGPAFAAAYDIMVALTQRMED